MIFLSLSMTWVNYGGSTTVYLLVIFWKLKYIVDLNTGMIWFLVQRTGLSMVQFWTVLYRYISSLCSLTCFLVIGGLSPKKVFLGDSKIVFLGLLWQEFTNSGGSRRSKRALGLPSAPNLTYARDACSRDVYANAQPYHTTQTIVLLIGLILPAIKNLDCAGKLVFNDLTTWFVTA